MSGNEDEKKRRENGREFRKFTVELIVRASARLCKKKKKKCEEVVDGRRIQLAFVREYIVSNLKKISFSLHPRTLESFN